MSKTKSSVKIFLLLLFLYFFLVSIKLLGHGFKVFGAGYAEQIVQATSNPLVAVSIGLLATALMQSSSTTTSIIVGLVAGGLLPIETAIFMVMGANIGTTVTNTLVSLGHVLRKVEFRRAFAGSTVHDFFNFLAVAVLLPVEFFFHPIKIGASFLSEFFSTVGGFEFISPLKIILNPAVKIVSSAVGENIIAIVFIALVIMFVSLYLLVKTMKSLVLGKIEVFLDEYLFKTALTSFCIGVVLTAVVQSSSITTSVVVPLLGAGVISLRKVFPYALGANVGTTITALLASLATGSVAALTVAFGHLLFNIFGIIIFYPLREIPISLAEKMGEIAYNSRFVAFVYIALVFIIIPIIIILLFDLHIVLGLFGGF